MKRSSRKSSKKKSSKKRSSVKKSSSKTIILSKSTNPNKKWMVKVDNKTVHFGAKGYEDYTIHKDKDRKERYDNRHKRNENWTKSGIKSAGFWSKWILWNKPSLGGSIRDTERRFGIKIRRSK